MKPKTREEESRQLAAEIQRVLQQREDIDRACNDSVTPILIVVISLIVGLIVWLILTCVQIYLMK